MKLKRKYLLLKFLFNIMKESAQDHEKLFEILGNMRGVPQKYGQFLYLKDKNKYKDFEKLLDEGLPFDNDTLYQRAMDLTDNTITLDQKPLASASIGQVYGGKLNDKEIIVKVQYPQIKAELLHDWKFINKIISIIFKFFRFPEESKDYLVDYLREFKETVDKETDYKQEVDNQQRFYHLYENHAFIHIPKVYAQYNSNEVIVEERCQGIPLTAFMKSANEEDKKDILDKLLFFYFDSFFKHGILHGDPHSGNFFVDKKYGENILEVVDFGCVKSYDLSYVASLKKLILYLQEESYQNIEDILIDLGFNQYELQSYGKALIPILNVIFEPFLENEEYDFNYWKITYQLNTIMGSKVFDKTLSLPKDLLVLFRVFHGMISHIYHLDDKTINLYQYIVKD